MVLSGEPGGRVGRCRAFFKSRRPARAAGLNFCRPHPPALASRAEPTSPASGEDFGRLRLPRSAAPRAEALDLASLGRRDVVRSTAHFAHEPLLLHLAAEVPKGLLELPGILYYDSHDPVRIPVSRSSLLLLEFDRPYGPECAFTTTLRALVLPYLGVHSAEGQGRRVRAALVDPGD
jgi:hypothetical protein